MLIESGPMAPWNFLGIQGFAAVEAWKQVLGKA